MAWGTPLAQRPGGPPRIDLLPRQLVEQRVVRRQRTGIGAGFLVLLTLLGPVGLVAPAGSVIPTGTYGIAMTVANSNLTVGTKSFQPSATGTGTTRTISPLFPYTSGCQVWAGTAPTPTRPPTPTAAEAPSWPAIRPPRPRAAPPTWTPSTWS